MRILIDNIMVCDGKGEHPGKVMVEDDKIKKVYKPTGRVQAKFDRYINGQGKVLMPGFIDMHCHLRDPGLTWKEDLNTGLHAAVKGGFTTVCAMGNTKPVIDNAEAVKSNVDRAGKLGLADLIQVCAATKNFSDTELVSFESARKVTPYFSNDGRNIDNAATMEKILEASKTYDFVIGTHNEPETETVKRDIALLEKIPGAHLHICHISRKETLDAIADAKKRGLDITCEVTPHHLYASALSFRVHPPFRSNDDKKALIEGARDGIIDICGTDHAPHSEEDKRAGAPGLINFETAFAMYHTVFDHAGIPLTRLSQMMSEAPAERLGLKTGLITEKYPADFVLVDPEAEWKVDVSTFVSKSRNTPFDGDILKGKILWTMKGGRIIYDHGSFV